VTVPDTRPPATRISIFNHKGGVGKTTLTMNIGIALAALGRRVLLVDSDPQCNLTSYLVAEDVVDDLLDSSDDPHKGQTVWSAVRPISEASGGFTPVEPIETGSQNMLLIPGDIRLSEFEADLNTFWGECLQRKVRGFRGTTGLSDLVSHVANEHDVDYVFYDSGPNIGALNRAILLDCDYFVVPVAADLFSLRALKTLGRTLVEWINGWATISELAPEKIQLLPGRPAFLGYIPQGFKVYGGAPTFHHAAFLARINSEVRSQVVSLLRALDKTLVIGPRGDYRLGEVKHFGALVPASQDEGRALYDVGAGSPQQREEARKALSQLAQRIDTKVQAHSVG
jgi:cellulose biosynthesis protein BcsQ